jgi:radical SAM superfamily enzyme YgiQ (UPF0313 family)
LVRKKGFKSVYWDDDTFNIYPGRTIEFADEIIHRGLNTVPWAIMARADLMTYEVLNRLRRAGLHAVKYGIENISLCSQKECGKKLDLQKAEEMIRYTRRIGIKTHLTFSFGFDEDTEKSIEETIEYALRLNPESVQFSILTPFPGTRLFDRLESEKRIFSHDWSFYDGHHGCVFYPKKIAPGVLMSYKDFAYRKWFDYKRKKRGVAGDIRRFILYARDKGLKYSFCKAKDYLKFILFYRSKYLRRDPV